MKKDAKFHIGQQVYAPRRVRENSKDEVVSVGVVLARHTGTAASDEYGWLASAPLRLAPVCDRFGDYLVRFHNSGGLVVRAHESELRAVAVTEHAP